MPNAIKHFGVLDIHPNISKDTLNGKTINQGVMFMQQHTGEGKLTHEGKTYTINIVASLCGSTILSVEGGRSAKINLQALVKLAIEGGLLDETMDFTETE